MIFQGFDGKTYIVLEIHKKRRTWIVEYRVPGIEDPVVAYLTTKQVHERLQLN